MWYVGHIGFDAVYMEVPNGSERLDSTFWSPVPSLTSAGNDIPVSPPEPRANTQPTAIWTEPDAI